MYKWRRFLLGKVCRYYILKRSTFLKEKFLIFCLAALGAIVVAGVGVAGVFKMAFWVAEGAGRTGGNSSSPPAAASNGTSASS
jgi:hypothetical protein